MSGNGVKLVEETFQLYEDFIKNWHEKRMKIEKTKNLRTKLYDKKRIYYSHKKFKTSIKSRISFEKSA